MKKIICLFLALMTLVPCVVACTPAGVGADGTTVGEDITTPDVTTVPDGTTAADTTASDTTVGDTTAGETTVPETTVPETTVPETTVPETTVPETTVPETTVPETTAEDPMKKIVDEALGYIEEKKYQKAYDLLKKHESNAQAKELLENFYFLPVKGERIPVEGFYYQKEYETYTYDKYDRLTKVYRYGTVYEIEYTFEYDKKGRLIKITHDNKKDGYKSVETYTYNSKGQLTEVDKKYTEGHTDNDRNEKYTYHSKGYLSKKVITTQHYTTTYVYDKNGDVTKYTEAYSENDVIEYNITYKAKGQPQKATVLYNGENIGTIEITYNKDGTRKKVELVYTDDENYVFEYTYKNGCVVKGMTTTPDGVTYKSYEYVYDSKGRLTKNYEWGAPDDFWSGSEYKYDSNGNVTNITRLDTNEKIKWRYEYKYDKYGNVISVYEINEYDDESRYEYEYRLAYVESDIPEVVKDYLVIINAPYVEEPIV